MAVKATNQIDLIDLTDGYTINLSSDAHTFIGTETKVNGTQSISTQVSAYRGNTAIGCTIGTITGADGAALPSGITAVATSGTEPIITITATPNLTSGGVINIPVQVNDSITIHKVFSYSIAFKGTDGADGQDGVDGEKGDSGEDALLLMIESTNGTIFKNTQIATTLSAHVYKGPLEVTGAALTALGTIKWYKDGGATAVKTGPTLTIAAGDITNKASYTAKLEA